MFLLIKNGRLRKYINIPVCIAGFLRSGILFPSASLELVDNLVVVIYVILLSWVVLLRTFSPGPVTIHRIQGAIVVYLLVSFVFAILYHSFYLIEGEQAFKGLSSFDRKEFMYFQFNNFNNGWVWRHKSGISLSQVTCQS
jgi:hypothetical protein